MDGEELSETDARRERRGGGCGGCCGVRSAARLRRLLRLLLRLLDVARLIRRAGKKGRWKSRKVKSSGEKKRYFDIERLLKRSLEMVKG